MDKKTAIVVAIGIVGLLAIGSPAHVSIYPGARATGTSDNSRTYITHKNYGWVYNLHNTNGLSVVIPITRNLRSSTSATVAIKVEDNNSSTNFSCKLYNTNAFHTDHVSSATQYSSGTGPQTLTLTITDDLIFDGALNILCNIPAEKDGLPANRSYIKLIEVTES